MSQRKQQHSTANSNEGQGRTGGLNLSSLVPAIVFVLILAVGLGFFISKQNASRVQARALAEQNSSIGLPDDYPSDIVPLYEGVKLLSAEKDSTESRDGEPMHRWTLKASSSEEPKAIYEYYNDLLLGQGLAQQMYISIPGGYGVDFADQHQIINLVIERDAADPKLTKLDITFNRLKSYKP